MGDKYRVVRDEPRTSLLVVPATAPTVLVIALKAAELSSPATETMLRTTANVLGPGTDVRVKATEQDPGSELLLSKSQDDALVIIRWTDPLHRVAELRGYTRDSKTWLDRSIAFSIDDPEPERGRTLGFIISAMFSAEVTRASRLEAAASSVQILPQQPARPTFWYGALAASLAGLGDSGSLGAMTRLERGPAQYYGGIYADARFGSISRAQSSTRFLGFGLVGNLRLLPSNGATWIGLVLQAGVCHVAVTRIAEGDVAAVRHVAWMPAAALFLGVTRELSRSTSLFVEAGPEYRFGSIDVYVHDRYVSRIPPWVGAVRLGLSEMF